MRLVEVTLHRCVVEEWTEVPDMFSEGGGHREIYSVIFFFQEGSVSVCLCMESSG